MTQILAYLGVHAEEELELKLGNDADCFLTRGMRLQIVTRCAGELLKRATQVAISALWATFQQLKFGSSKVVPKDGDVTNTHPCYHVSTSTCVSFFPGTVHEVTSLYVQRAHKMSILEKQVLA